VVGTVGPSRIGSPISTEMVPSAFITGMMGPARVLTRYDSAIQGVFVDCERRIVRRETTYMVMYEKLA
jgi:hypothetical protein